jgi:hypothetical protein
MIASVGSAESHKKAQSKSRGRGQQAWAYSPEGYGRRTMKEFWEPILMSTDKVGQCIIDTAATLHILTHVNASVALLPAQLTLHCEPTALAAELQAKTL